MFASELRLPNMDKVLSHVAGVTGAHYDEKERILTVNYTGSYMLISKVEQAVQDMGVSAALVSPLHVVLTVTGLKSKADCQAKLESTGASYVCEDAGQWHVFTDLKVLRPDTFEVAAKAIGAQCQMTSHEWIVLTVDKDPIEILKEIADLKNVLRVDSSDKTLSVFALRGGVSVGTIESILKHRGFKTAK